MSNRVAIIHYTKYVLSFQAFHEGMITCKFVTAHIGAWNPLLDLFSYYVEY